jgi:type V secretory pathway adhesin AidA
MGNKKISQLPTGSENPPLTAVIPVVYSGETFQHQLSTLRETLVDSGSHQFTGDQTFIGNVTIVGGNTTITGSLNVTGSVNVSDVLNLKPLDVLPIGSIGDLSVSGSKLYFNNGDWVPII